MDEDEFIEIVKRLEKNSLEFQKNSVEAKSRLQAIQSGIIKVLDQLNDQDERIKDIESYLAQKETFRKK